MSKADTLLLTGVLIVLFFFLFFTIFLFCFFFLRFLFLSRAFDEEFATIMKPILYLVTTCRRVLR